MKKYFLILFFAGIILYLPSLFGPFLWDDEDFVYANKYVAEFRVDKFFTESQTAGRDKNSNYYRPLPQIAYATTHAVFGFTPFWYHLLNIAFHIGAACAIFYFFYLLTKNQTIALLTSLVFLVHPVQTEAVSYISGLSDPMFVLFGFLSLIFFLKKKNWWSLGFFTLSILSKETGLVFLPLLIVLGILNKSWKTLWSQLTISLLYLWFHFTSINSFDIKSAWGNNPYANSLIVRLLTFIQNLYLYFALMLFPAELFMERDFTISIQTNFLNPYLFGFIIFLALIGLLLYKQKGKENFNNLIFCFLGFFICFIPYTGILLINGIFYEHFLYLPLVFFFAFLLILAEKYLKNKYVLYTIYVVLILFSLRNFIRQFDWNDSVRFYTQTLIHAPKSIRIINGLGMAYAENGDIDNSISTYQKGIKIDPTVPNLYHNLANAEVARGNVEEAEKNYLKALEVNPNFFFSAQSLANLYQQTEQQEKLKKLLEKYNK